MKWVLIGFIVVLFIAAIIAWQIISGIFGAGKGILETTFDSDNIITQYEQFRDKYNRVLAMDEQYLAAEQDETQALTFALADDNVTLLEQRNLSQMATITRGIRSRQNELIGEYNADASKANVQIFQNPKLFGHQFGDIIPSTLAFR